MNEFICQKQIMINSNLMNDDLEEQKKKSILYLGCLLFVFGCIGLLWMLLNPFHIFGVFVYLGIGSYLMLQFGKDFLHKYLPQSVCTILFEKSCLDLILHSNTFYQILGIVLISKSGIKKEIQEFLLKNQLSTISTELIAKPLPNSPAKIQRLLVKGVDSLSLSVSPASSSVSPVHAIPLLPSPSSVTYPLTPVSKPTSSKDQHSISMIASSLQLFPSSPTDLLKLDPATFFLQDSLKQSTISKSTRTTNELEKNIINFYNLFLYCIWNFLESKLKDYQNDFLLSLQQYSSPDYLLSMPWMQSISQSFQSTVDHLLSLRLESIPIFPQDSSLAERLSVVMLQYQQTRKDQAIAPVFRLIGASSSYLVAVQKMKTTQIQIDSLKQNEQILIEEKSRREVATYLSYLLLMLMAYRWQILPRKISWLQRMVLARLLQDLASTQSLSSTALTTTTIRK